MPHRLLLADDSVTIQRVIELTFAEEAVDVVSVGDGVQAIDRLGERTFDIVLADVGMPGKDGFEVAPFVGARPSWPAFPCVLLTGAFDALDEARWPRSGCGGGSGEAVRAADGHRQVRQLLSGRPGIGSPDGRRGAVGRAVCRARPRAVCRRLLRSPRQRVCDAATPRSSPATRSTTRAGVQAPEPVPLTPEATRPPPGAAQRAGGPPPGLADTFATLLAVEQGELPASGPASSAAPRR